MLDTIEQRPTRREVLPYNGIRANTQPLCPEFWIQVKSRIQQQHTHDAHKWAAIAPDGGHLMPTARRAFTFFTRWGSVNKSTMSPTPSSPPVSSQSTPRPISPSRSVGCRKLR
jgi:hypothetical protein